MIHVQMFTGEQYTQRHFAETTIDSAPANYHTEQKETLIQTSSPVKGNIPNLLAKLSLKDAHLSPSLPKGPDPNRCICSSFDIFDIQ